MSIVNKGPLPNPSIDVGKQVTINVKYQLEATTFEDPVDVAAWFETNVAVYNASYPGYPAAKLTNYSPTAQADGLSWVVDVTFSTNEQDQSPLAKPVRYEPFLQSRQRNIFRDINSRPIVNKAGVPFSGGLAIDDPQFGFSLVKNYATFNLSAMYQYRRAVNLDTFYGFRPGVVKCVGITPREVAEGSDTYIEATFTFLCQEEGWTEWLLNEGKHEKIDGKLKPILAGTTEITDPVPLDNAGRKLADGGTPIFLPFEVCNRLPFSSVFPTS